MTAPPRNPKRGDIWQDGRRIYGVCHRCGALIRWNKPLVGSLHLCNDDGGERD